MSTDEDALELLAEMRRLVERFPLPHPIWHRFVPEMHEVIRDLFVALGAVAELPRAQTELLHRVASGAADTLLDPGPALAAARARMRELPIPQGEHPYLDEILVTLEAGRFLVAALIDADGEAVFARRLEKTSSK